MTEQNKPKIVRLPEREVIIKKKAIPPSAKLKLDRPELREKIAKVQRCLRDCNLYPYLCRKWAKCKVGCDLRDYEMADQLLAIIPDEEEIRKQERERIWAWGLLMCDDYDHTNITLPSEMGGGKVKKNNRRRARCAECWRTLLGKP